MTGIAPPNSATVCGSDHSPENFLFWEFVEKFRWRLPVTSGYSCSVFNCWEKKILKGDSRLLGPQIWWNEIKDRYVTPKRASLSMWGWPLAQCEQGKKNKRKDEGKMEESSWDGKDRWWTNSERGRGWKSKRKKVEKQGRLRNKNQR